MFVCSPNNPTGTVEPAATIEALLAADGDHLVVVDEAYGEFAPWSALELVRDDRPLVVVRTYSKVWSMAALRLGFAVGAARGSSTSSTRWCCRTTSTSATQIAGRLALDLGDEMDDRVQRLVDERERRRRRARPHRRRHRVPVGRQLPAVPPRAATGHERWQQMVDQGVLVRDFSRWPGLEDCLRVTIGTPEENDAFLAALRELAPAEWRRPMPRTSEHAPHHEGDRRSTSCSTSTARATRRRRPASRSSTTCSSSSASTAASTSASRPTGDLEVDTHHTVEDVGIVLGTALKEALGDKAGVRRFASSLCPLDEALVQVALDLSGRPFLVYDVDPGLGVHRHVRPAARRGVLARVRVRRRHHAPPPLACRAATATT